MQARLEELESEIEIGGDGHDECVGRWMKGWMDGDDWVGWGDVQRTV